MFIHYKETLVLLDYFKGNKIFSRYILETLMKMKYDVVYRKEKNSKIVILLQVYLKKHELSKFVNFSIFHENEYLLLNLLNFQNTFSFFSYRFTLVTRNHFSDTNIKKFSINVSFQKACWCRYLKLVFQWTINPSGVGVSTLWIYHVQKSFSYVCKYLLIVYAKRL